MKRRFWGARTDTKQKYKIDIQKGNPIIAFNDTSKRRRREKRREEGRRE